MTQRVAVVTGAAQGIGAAIARELASDGHKVVVADLNLAGAEEVASGIDGLALHLDVSDPDQVDAFTSRVLAELGRVDILVNNAAIVPFTPWSEMTFENWRRVMSVNVDGMYLMTRALGDVMIKAGWGRIIQIASNTFVAGTPNCSQYVATKGAAIGFVRSLAGEIGQFRGHHQCGFPGLDRDRGSPCRTA